MYWEEPKYEIKGFFLQLPGNLQWTCAWSPETTKAEKASSTELESTRASQGRTICWRWESLDTVTILKVHLPTHSPSRLYHCHPGDSTSDLGCFIQEKRYCYKPSCLTCFNIFSSWRAIAMVKESGCQA